MTPIETKFFEIRDRQTYIPVMATRVPGPDGRAGQLCRSVGHRAPFVALTVLDSGKTYLWPEDWGDRTMQVAHKYIFGSWTKLEDGAVVDVEFILLEVDKPKKSQFDEKGPYADY